MQSEYLTPERDFIVDENRNDLEDMRQYEVARRCIPQDLRRMRLMSIVQLLVVHRSGLAQH